MSKKANKKPPFNPFARIGQCTAPLRDPGPPEETRSAEFNDTLLIIAPALPRVEVSLRVQFRCTVPIVEGDTITIQLPNFKGPAGMFSPESRPHPDGLNLARYFHGYWSGGEKRAGQGKNGVPPKQVLMLRCLKRVNEGTLVVFAVPQSVGIISADKLAANSAKVKMEGKLRHASEGKIPKQSFLGCTEIRKKVPIVEELEQYEEVIARLMESGRVGKAERYIAEEVLLEEVDQMLEAAQQRRPYPVAMPWSIATTVFHDYEEAGGFVKKVMENSVAVVKKRDPLAVHKEVAENWGVKVGVVVVLEDVLAMRHAALYPGLSRTAILAAFLLTLEPVDVARVFSLSRMPSHSILLEINSAYRTRDLLGGGGDAEEGSGSGMDGGGAPAMSRCERLLTKWSALIAVLMTATIPAQLSDENSDGFEDLDENNGGDTEDDAAAGEVEGEEAAGRHTVRFSCPQREAPAVLLQDSPPLFLGLRDVPQAELAYLHHLHAGQQYMFPSFVVARQSFPLLQESPDTDQLQSQHQQLDGTQGRGGAAHDSDNSDIGADTDSIPDNAVVFELRGVVEALELADVSMYPSNREWLLPLSSSFRVVKVSVRGEFNDLTHVELEMVGSLVGSVDDVMIPESDQVVASMLLRKLRVEFERGEEMVQSIAHVSYLNARLNDRRRLHPPTLMRAQYLTHFHEVKRASEAKQAVEEEGIVTWQVCTHPPQMLERGVVKPASWEPIPKKIAPSVELFFLGRTRTRRILEEGALTLNLNDFTIDYGGKGPRLLRRVVGRRVTHEAPSSIVFEELVEREEATSKQLYALDVKLGLAPANMAGTTASSPGKGQRLSSAKPTSAKKRG